MVVLKSTLDVIFISLVRGVKPGLNEHQMDTGNGWMVSGYNFSYLPPDRQWIKELLLNQSDEESDKDEEANVDFVLKVHRKCQKWRRQYHSNPIQVSLFSSER